MFQSAELMAWVKYKPSYFIVSARPIFMKIANKLILLISLGFLHFA